MRFPRIPFLVVGVVLVVLRALGQSPNGNINGLVLDPSSRVIASAEIIAVNDLTNVQFTAKTNQDGVYVLANLLQVLIGCRSRKPGSRRSSSPT
jgi:hypothetical protein